MKKRVSSAAERRLHKARVRSAILLPASKKKGPSPAYLRAWVKSRRDAWLLENGPCKKCGSPERLEVDHIVAATKAPFLKKGMGSKRRNLWGLATPKRLKELAKCQVLCHSCHKLKTAEETGRPAPGPIYFECAFCGTGKELNGSVYRSRLKQNKSGRLFCSKGCAAKF